MRTFLLWLAIGYASQINANAWEVGDRVVVTQPTTMQVITGSTLPLTTGTSATVRAVESDRLKVAVPRVGWIAAGSVIPVGEADQYFSDKLEASPTDAALLLARGKVRSEQAGLDPAKLEVAIADLDASIQQSPSSEAHTLRGFAWKRKGDKDRAIADFDEAIRLNPKEALAWRVRGATYASKAEYGKTLADYSESIRVDPDNPDSRHHRVVLRSACMDERFRNGQQAIEDATKSCELSEWANPLYLSGLAMANAEAGNFDEALKWQRKAMELTKSPVASMTANLELYEQHKPFRMTWR